ncbi:YTH domain-containing protein [archaeon]|nr:YTH domain-containing protein [archaeon]
MFNCSTNGSGRFVGVARMATEVDYEKMFMYWTQDGKWGGMMGVEWLFIKDVPFKEFKNIEIMMK